MICTQCGKHNEHGKFCGDCGAPLSTTTNGTAHNSNEKDTSIKNSVSDGWNKIKQSDAYKQGISVSKQYGSYFLQTIKAPAEAVNSVTRAHFINAIITIVLSSIFMPLTTYFMASQFSFGPVPFAPFVVKPFVLIVVSFAVSSLVAFGLLRLAKVKTDYVTVLSKIGVLFVPALVAFMLSTLTAMLDMSYSVTMFFFSIGLLAVVIAHAHLLLTARKENEGGFDLIYGAIITVVVLLYIVSQATQISVKGILGNIF